MFLHGDPLVVSAELARRYELAHVPVVRSGRLLPLLTFPSLGITSSFRVRRQAHQHRAIPSPDAGPGSGPGRGERHGARHTALTAR